MCLVRAQDDASIRTEGTEGIGMDLWVVYDDRMRPPNEVRAAVGIENFGALLYRKRILSEHIRELMRQAGALRFFILRDDADIASVLKTLADASSQVQVVYFPSCLTTTDPGLFRLLLRKLRYTQEAFILAPSPRSQLPFLAFPARQALQILPRIQPGAWQEGIDSLPFSLHALGQQGHLLDLSEPGALVSFLSSTFDARHFNSIHQDQLVVTKRSSDIDKIRREYRYFGLLPESMRLFFLPPLGFSQGSGWAEYRLERLYIPDVAIQWVHRSFNPETFSELLDRIFSFIALRPTRERSTGDAAKSQDALYLDKVVNRLDKFRLMPLAGTIDRMLADCTPYGSLQSLADRYTSLWRQRRDSDRREAISHGDLCFSNILYSRQNRLTKFIDPRGSDDAEGLWLDANYDLAKLSHSILGSYDFINHDLCEITLDRNLGCELRLDDSELEPLRVIFRSCVLAAGFNLRAIRLAEASLFLSMLPLHSDVPKKVLAFALTAAQIIEQLEVNKI
jgi:hypothetical protein